jgi:hypothetical protein
MWDKFGFNDYEMARRSQGKMEDFMEMLVETTNDYKVELLAKGYTQAKIDEGIALSESIRQEQLDQEKAKKDRPYETQERIIILNECWDAMVFVTSAAKAVFYGNFAKLHQYILPEGSSYEQHTFKGPISFGETINTVKMKFNAMDVITLEAIDVELHYGLMDSATGKVEAGIVVAAGESKVVTASELGDVITCEYLNVTNLLPASGTYKVVI